MPDLASDEARSSLMPYMIARRAGRARCALGFLFQENGRHAGFQAGGHEGLPGDNAGDGAVESATARLHRSLVAISVTQRPFVFEKVQDAVCACESALPTALQPDSYRPGPWNIVLRHIFLLSCHQWS